MGLRRTLRNLVSNIRGHWLFALSSLSTIIFIAYFFKHVPPPGYSATALAVVAVIISVHAKIETWQKIVWLCLILLLLRIEIISITRSIQEAREQNKLQMKRFDEIHTAQLLEFDATLNKFNETTQRLITLSESMNTLASMSRSNLDATTGNGSIPCVIPDVHAAFPNNDGVVTLPVTIVNKGKFNLSAVSVGFIESSTSKNAQSGEMINIGTLAPGIIKYLPTDLNPDVDSGSHIYQFTIFTQNGNYTEYLFVKHVKSNDDWKDWKYIYYLQKWAAYNPKDLDKNGFLHPLVSSTLVSGCSNKYNWD